jgi:prepilin-type processing-associated H-X9-DG protein
LTHKNRFFSLIELLVVISIIVLLTNLLFPSLRRIHDRALRFECAQNFMRVGVAAGTYVLDYMKPVPGHPNRREYDKWGNGPGRVWWNYLIVDYTTDYRIMACPSEIRPPRFFGEELPYPRSSDSVYRFHAGYGWNWYNDSFPSDASEFYAMNVNEIKSPGNKIVCLEVNDQVVGGPLPAVPGRGWNWWVQNTTRVNADGSPGFAFGSLRHEEKMNLLFFDGHVSDEYIEDLDEDKNFDPSD